MVRKISLTIFSLAIVCIGIIAFNNLHYWERSVRIFETRTEQPSRRGGDRTPQNFDRNSLPERFQRQAPDTIHSENERNEPGITQDTTSTPQNRGERTENIRENRDFREGTADRSRNDRGDFRGRSRSEVRLANVGWFLGVFALFTVVTVYIDKLFKILFKKKEQSPTATKK